MGLTTGRGRPHQDRTRAAGGALAARCLGRTAALPAACCARLPAAQGGQAISHHNNAPCVPPCQAKERCLCAPWETECALSHVELDVEQVPSAEQQRQRDRAPHAAALLLRLRCCCCHDCGGCGERAAAVRGAGGVAAVPGGCRIAPARIVTGPQTSPHAPAPCCCPAWATVTGLLLRRGLPSPAGRSSCALRCDGCRGRDGSCCASPAAGRACKLLLLQGRRRAAGRWQASMDAMVAL